MSIKDASSKVSIPGLRERMSKFNTIRHTDSLKYVVPDPACKFYSSVPQWFTISLRYLLAAPPRHGLEAAINIYDNKDDSSTSSSSCDDEGEDDEEDDENSDSEYEQHSDDEPDEEDSKSVPPQPGNSNAANKVATLNTYTQLIVTKTT